MMDSLIQQMDMICTGKPIDKTKVLIDGNLISRYRRITICGVCAKRNGRSHPLSTRLVTSAGYLHDMEAKYKYKIMGKYRFKKWLQKQNKLVLSSRL